MGDHAVDVELVGPEQAGAGADDAKGDEEEGECGDEEPVGDCHGGHRGTGVSWAASRGDWVEFARARCVRTHQKRGYQREAYSPKRRRLPSGSLSMNSSIFQGRTLRGERMVTPAARNSVSSGAAAPWCR